MFTEPFWRSRRTFRGGIDVCWSPPDDRIRVIANLLSGNAARGTY